MLLIYNKNKNGLRIDFWGIFEVVCLSDEEKLFKKIFCFFFIK